MIEIGFGIILAFMASLCFGGLFAWSWTLYRWWNRLPIYSPEMRLPATWGFAEVLLCVGIYVILTASIGLVLALAGVDLRVQPAAAVETVASSVEPASKAETTTPETTAEPVQPTESPSEPENTEPENTEPENTEPENTEPENTEPVDRSRDMQKLGAVITIDGAARLLTIVAVMLLLFFFDKKIISRFGWVPRRHDIALGVVASCMLLPPLFALQALLTRLVPYEHPVLEIINEHPAPWLLVAMAFTTIVVAPLAEEFFFRGLLQGWLQRIAAPLPAPATNVTDSSPSTSIEGTPASSVPAERGMAERGMAEPLEMNQPIGGAHVAAWPTWPVFLSSLLFALVHLGHGAAPIALFFLALGLGWLYRLTGRLWASITVHVVLNMISTLMTILAALADSNGA